MNELWIVGAISEFRNKNSSWFRKNKRNIEHARAQNLFWERNSFVIHRNATDGMRPVVERLLDLGYTVTHWPETRGEFTTRGGAIIVFPVNESLPYRIDFFGNTIESIERLRSHQEKDLPENRFRKYFEYLRYGDYVVHQDHGIGMWHGIQKERGKEYFCIEYRGARTDGAPDTLLVPLSEEKRITPYIGFRVPPITRLGTPLWKRIIKQTKEDALLFARKLLEVQARREIAERNPYPPSHDIEEKLEESFPHKETASQLRVLEDIMHDLESATPMDRLLLGDVGFGKTEIALRASVRVAAMGKQVAVLAPTTLLADQHVALWRDRLRDLPLTVAHLSRLKHPQEISRVLREIERGSIDIVIGTHRLLSKDVLWKNLGLLIIDEEQRFGVRAKEQLKEIKKDIDVLTLSATPLPRTLSMALSSLKKMSVLEDPPEGRRAPQTFVLPYRDTIVYNAIEHEIARRGQIYVLEGRIRTIPHTLDLLRTLLPRRTIGYIHGRMGEKNLIETMEKFRQRKIEILVSTTIIENGIDLSDVNTLIVPDATLFGLAELHQLRGRVGRSTTQAYAYFLYNSQRLTSLAKNRLDILSSTQFLGSGSLIAEKDLEMRGAGNILGREQSGVARAVGLNLYSQFLAEAIEKLRS